MREIEFRAWCMPEDRMISGDQPGNDELFMEYVGDHYMITQWSSDIILMACAGVKDKNGTDIYEGDIVQWGVSTYMHVVFVNGAFLQTDEGMSPDIWYDWGEVEIVGNIYENDDLLTKAI